MVNFHIEPTSKCTLECPLCDRTWFYEKFKKRELHEINVEQLTMFLGSNAKIYFCGNNGDPIYHSKFIELCSKLVEELLPQLSKALTVNNSETLIAFEFSTITTLYSLSIELRQFLIIALLLNEVITIVISLIDILSTYLILYYNSLIILFNRSYHF